MMYVTRRDAGGRRRYERLKQREYMVMETDESQRTKPQMF
jgi:hypothetical protein